MDDLSSQRGLIILISFLKTIPSARIVSLRRNAAFKTKKSSAQEYSSYKPGTYYKFSSHLSFPLKIVERIPHGFLNVNPSLICLTLCTHLTQFYFYEKIKHRRN